MYFDLCDNTNDKAMQLTHRLCNLPVVSSFKRACSYKVQLQAHKQHSQSQTTMSSYRANRFRLFIGHRQTGDVRFNYKNSHKYIVTSNSQINTNGNSFVREISSVT